MFGCVVAFREGVEHNQAIQAKLWQGGGTIPEYGGSQPGLCRLHRELHR